ncbi:hypothetical protein [Tsuneonella sp. HG222]
MSPHRPRWLALAASLAVAACGSGTGGSSAAAEPAAAGEDDRIECALDGANAFARDCTVERSTAEGQSLLVVRHPDGAFRRFAIVTDGRGVIAADGAQAGKATLGDGTIELWVDDDRYRFPATVSDAGG